MKFLPTGLVRLCRNFRAQSRVRSPKNDCEPAAFIPRTSIVARMIGMKSFVSGALTSKRFNERASTAGDVSHHVCPLRQTDTSKWSTDGHLSKGSGL